MHLLFVIHSAFTTWMLFDSVQRRAGCQWCWIILLPFGPYLYFFTVKINDPEFKRMKVKLVQKRAGLKELKYQAARSPSVHNKLLLAEALHDHSEFSEAAKLFQEVLDIQADEKRALYGLGLCRIQLREAEQAVGALERLFESDLAFQDYAPACALAEAYWEQGKHDDAVRVMERVAKKSQRLVHKTTLADLLCRKGQVDAARKLLHEALEDHENSPAYVKRGEKAAAKRAKFALKELPQAAQVPP